eukprot:m.234000 g.234000  ORF g.234000 m.234000 type:complete len:78 (-) comp10884_c0_seq10:1951-2184(-)
MSLLLDLRVHFARNLMSVRRKITEGERPVLPKVQFSQPRDEHVFVLLCSLMSKSWSQISEVRPTMQDIVAQLERSNV